MEEVIVLEKDGSCYRHGAVWNTPENPFGTKVQEKRDVLR